MSIVKTVLITGATSGFGAATARLFAKAGWRVVVTGRRADRLQSLVDELGEGTVYPLAFDMRDVDAIGTALDSLPDPFQQIDLLINNAGLALGTKPVQEADPNDWYQMIETNITGLVTITHRLVPQLIERKGAIINMSSVAASYPYPGGNAYGGTKAFVVQFSLGLRSDLHGTGVRVSCVEPGIAETEFTLVRTKGNQEASDKLYKGAAPLTAEDIAETLFWIANQPPHVNINRVEIMPVSQSTGPFQIHRDEG